MSVRQLGASFYLYLGGGIVLLLVAILFKPFTIVNPGERGIVMHLGEVQDQILKASRQAQAEVNRAKGTAEAQKLLRQSLNKELLEKQAIEKWDGKFPTVMGGNGALPLINISPPQQ
jgi:regulator of protease activity HflC (stomatin/prohibitin superfamily)